MGKIGDLWVKLGIKKDDYDRGIESAEDKAEGFGAKIKSLGQEAKLAWTLMGVGLAAFAKSFIQESQTIGDAWARTTSAMSTRWKQLKAELTSGLTGGGWSSGNGMMAALGGLPGLVYKWFGGGGAKSARQTGRAAADAADALTEVEYAFQLGMSELEPKLHQLYLDMVNTALTPEQRATAGKEYRTLVEQQYKPMQAALKEYAAKAGDQWLAIAGLNPKDYSLEDLESLFKQLGTDAAGVEREHKAFYDAYQHVSDADSAALVEAMTKYHNAENQMNSMLRRSDRQTQSAENADLSALLKGTSGNDWAEAMRNEVASVNEEWQKMVEDTAYYAELEQSLLDEIMSKVPNNLSGAAALHADVVHESAMQLQELAQSQELAAEAADTARASLETETDRVNALNDSFADTLASSVSGGIQALTDMAMGIEGAGFDQVMAGLLTPFANTATQLGEMLIAQGTAIEVFKTSLSSLNGFAAIAAGTALLAVGAAMSSGIKALGASAGGSSAVSTGGSSASASSTSTQDISTEMTVYVKGKISGKDIIISGDNARKYYAR